MIIQQCQKSKYFPFLVAFVLFLLAGSCASGQVYEGEAKKQKEYGHDRTRSLRYRPDGGDFVIINGGRRFNRALYGSNTAFRVEAGDLPEFALYLPGMGGNFQFGLIAGDQEKWLIEAEEITARYRAGSMHYEIKDALLGSGKLLISVLPMYEGEGMLVKTQFADVSNRIELIWVFGGVTGKKFSRGGDIGADPESSFYLKTENCKGNTVKLEADNTFRLYYRDGEKSLGGVFPTAAEVKIADAEKLKSPLALWQSDSSAYAVITGKLTNENEAVNYFAIYHPESREKVHYEQIQTLFEQAEQDRLAIAERVTVKTPDPYINTLGGALAMAADAIWEYPSFLHGAVAWRMPLNGWRGAYSGDWLGWHDRAHTHFASYAESQYTAPASGPSVPDPETHLARQKEVKGTALFTSGYISRRPGGISNPHHYDMNQVFIDQLLRHFDWTGDTAFLKEMWPLIQRHLAWETRNFDPDDDGLYSAYASIWASDALAYNGGGVAYSSAYNHLAFKSAARLAEIIGGNPEPYRKEAEKILTALNDNLWLSDKGWYAEYKDILGNKSLHKHPGLWSVYHLMDSEVPDPFQAYQLLRYVDTEIPHIPIMAEGMPEGDYYTLSTTNWMPYTWSVNNVAMAEVLHTALAYWQSNRSEDAFKLWKSALLESMYLGASPGNFQQLSFYDAMRGELYRDNGDPVGMAARTLVEGLFGIKPDLLNKTLVIKPGLPGSWAYATLKTPDIVFDFKRDGDKDIYHITTAFGEVHQLDLKLKARSADVSQVLVNGEAVKWTAVQEAVGYPRIKIVAPIKDVAKVEVEWAGEAIETLPGKDFVVAGEGMEVAFDKAKILEIFDPQHAMAKINQGDHQLKAVVNAKSGNKTFFVQVAQGRMKWWAPVTFEVGQAISIITDQQQTKNVLSFSIKNHTAGAIVGQVTINPGKDELVLPLALKSGAVQPFRIDNLKALNLGNNTVAVVWPQGKTTAQVANWNIYPLEQHWETVNLRAYFNDQVSQIFKNEYLSPRSPYPTLQIPVHGLGDWCSYKAYMEIDDTGLRQLAGEDNVFTLRQEVPFASPGERGVKNIVFTALWDNYPDSVTIPLSGKAKHAYFLIAGSTNPMQSRFENGVIEIVYADGSKDILPLINPETWWPIEQDYYLDGYAFAMDVPKPVRVHLKTGWMGEAFEDYVAMGNFTKYAIDGGAATVLDLPLESEKELKHLRLKTTANDVVIGLMSLTLVRE